MGKKRRISITTVILIPVFVLGLVCIISSVQAISNIKQVNANASEIADEYMVSISKLSEIQKETQAVHTKGLSHIIATDLDTMITMVDSIRAEQKILEDYLDDYEKNYLMEADRAAFDAIVSNYEGMKYEIVRMMAYSANNRKVEAHDLANGAIADYSNAIQNQINQINQNATAAATGARDLPSLSASSCIC